MYLLEHDDDLVHKDPDDNTATISDMFEFIDEVEQTQNDILSPDETPNLGAVEDLLEIDDDIMREAQKMASKDPEAIAHALDSIIKDMENEYILTTNELKITKDNLATFHRDVETAIEQEQPIPDNYMKTSEALLQNIKTQQEKLKNLSPKLEQAKKAYLDYADKINYKEKNSELLALVYAFVKKTIQIFTRGLTDLGNMLHDKNQSFACGSKQAMRDVGDKAQAIYTKMQAKQQKLTLSFKKLYKKIVSKTKEMSQDMKLKRSLHKEIKEEKKAAKRIDSLTEKLAKATAKVKGLEPTTGKESLVKNAFYNYALDQARTRQGELIQAMKERYEAIPHYTYKIEDAIIASHKMGAVTKDTLATVQEMSWKEKDKYIDDNFSSMKRDDIKEFYKASLFAIGEIASNDGVLIKVESQYEQKDFPLYVHPDELPKDVPENRSAELNQFDKMFKFIESPLMQEAFLSNLEEGKGQPEQGIEYDNKTISNLTEALNKAKATVATLNGMSHKNVEVPTMSDPFDR